MLVANPAAIPRTPPARASEASRPTSFPVVGMLWRIWEQTQNVAVERPGTLTAQDLDRPLRRGARGVFPLIDRQCRDRPERFGEFGKNVAVPGLFLSETSTRSERAWEAEPANRYCRMRPGPTSPARSRRVLTCSPTSFRCTCFVPLAVAQQHRDGDAERYLASLLRSADHARHAT